MQTVEPAGRVWLDVPYAEKDAARAAGARWDPAAQRWYVESHRWRAAMQRWSSLPDLLPGEDRSAGSGLFVDLVPSSCWFTNVRSCVAPADWDRLRRMVYRRAGHRCEICGATRDEGARLEAHERWAYTTATQVQRLVRLLCLCSACHEVTHFGLAEVRGRRAAALSHLMAVNEWDLAGAEAHVAEAAAIWEQRSQLLWELDLTVLTQAGISIAPPPPPEARFQAAQRLR